MNLKGQGLLLQFSIYFYETYMSVSVVALTD